MKKILRINFARVKKVSLTRDALLLFARQSVEPFECPEFIVLGSTMPWSRL